MPRRQRPPPPRPWIPLGRAWAGVFAVLMLGTGCPTDERGPLDSTCDRSSACLSELCWAGRCLDPAADADSDGLPNGLERDLGGDLLAVDTDGDGILDGDEVTGAVARDTDGDGRPDISESALDDADGDCITDQFDAHDRRPDADLSPMRDVVCATIGLCSRIDRSQLRVTCGPDGARCDYTGVSGYADPEACDGADDNCDGRTDEGFADTDGDRVADCVDADLDGDGIDNAVDNCPRDANPDQQDGDLDGVGGACIHRVTLVVSDGPAAVVAGEPFTAVVVVVDERGEPVPRFRGAITLTLEPVGGAAELSGVTTRVASAGQASFDGLSVTAPGAGLTLRASAGALSRASSAPFEAVAGAAVRLEIAAPAASVVAGEPAEITVSAVDVRGNIATAYTGTIRISTDDSNATVPAEVVVSAADAGSVVVPMAWTLAGERTIEARGAPGASLNATASLTVVPAAPSDLVVRDLPTPVRAGAPFGVRVSTTDRYDNHVGAFVGVISAGTDAPGAVVPAPVTVAPGDDGTATFGGFVLTVAGPTELEFATEGGGLSRALTVDVRPALPYRAVVGAPASVQAGEPFTVDVTFVDAFGNPSPFGRTIQFALDPPDPKATLPPAYTFIPADGAHRAFDGVVLRAGGAVTLQVLDDAEQEVLGEAPLEVIGPTRHLRWREPPAHAIAHEGLGAFSVELTDGDGVIVTDEPATLTLSLVRNPTRARLGGPRSAALVGGVATFAGVAIEAAGVGFVIEVAGADQRLRSDPIDVTWAAPIVSDVAVVASDQPGCDAISYRVAHPGGRPVFVAAELSTDGQTWTAISHGPALTPPMPGQPAEQVGVHGVRAPPAGEVHSLVWDAVEDLGDGAHEGVVVAVRASVGGRRSEWALSSPTKVSIRAWAGDQTWLSVHDEPQQSGMGATGAAPADVDRHGGDDVVISGGTPVACDGGVCLGDVLFAVGGTHDAPPRQETRAITVPLGFTSGRLVDPTAGDLDGDGQVELLLHDVDRRELRRIETQVLGPTDVLYADGGAIAPCGRDDDEDSDDDDEGAELVGYALGDVDGDGWPDLVVTCASEAAAPSLRLLMNDGAAFDRRGPRRPLASGARFVRLVDLRGDGSPEILVGDGQGVIVFVNDGVGGFRPKPDHVLSAGPASDLTAADYDRDGRVDLAVLAAAGTVHVFWGRHDGFDPSTTAVASSLTAAHVTSGDVDRDGRADLVVVDAGTTLAPLLSDGARGFDEVGVLALTDDNNTGVADVVAVDLSRDGVPDLVVPRTDGGVSIAIAAPPARCGGPPRGPSPSVVPNATTAALLADTSGDGQPDWWVAYDAGDDAGIGVSLGAGDGNTRVPHGPPRAAALPIQSPAVEMAFITLLGLPKGPSAVIAVHADGGVSVTPSPGGPAEAPGVQLPYPPAASIAVDDIDLDGADDALVVTRDGRAIVTFGRPPRGPHDTLESLVADVFGDPVTLDTHGVAGATLADVDRDGHLDLVYMRAETSPPAVCVQPSGSDRSFGLRASASCSTFGAPGTAARSAPWVGDVDADGAFEVLAISAEDDEAPGELVILEASEPDGLAFERAAQVSVCAGVRAIAVADVDGDERVDIVAHCGVWALHKVEVLRQQTDGSFDARDLIGLGDPDDPATDFVVGHFDADLRADIGVAGEMWRDVGATVERPGVVVGSDDAADTLDLWTADFNGDGITDVLTRALGSPRIYLVEGGPDGAFAAPRPVPLPADVKTIGRIAVGDLGGDLRPDILVTYESLAGARSWARLVRAADDDPGFIPHGEGSLGFLESAVALGDVDRDGRGDVAFVTRAPAALAVHHQRVDGGFTATHACPAGACPSPLLARLRALAIGQFDPDAAGELVVMGDCPASSDSGSCLQRMDLAPCAHGDCYAPAGPIVPLRAGVDGVGIYKADCYGRGTDDVITVVRDPQAAGLGAADMIDCLGQPWPTEGRLDVPAAQIVAPGLRVLDIVPLPRSVGRGAADLLVFGEGVGRPRRTVYRGPFAIARGGDRGGFAADDMDGDGLVDALIADPGTGTFRIVLSRQK